MRQNQLDREVYHIVNGKAKTDPAPRESRSRAAIARANQTDKKQLSAQDSIPYQRMFPDGICRVTDTFYTKTVQYQDINYQLSQNEDKTAIFEGWCDFLNYFDSSIRFQLSFLNLDRPAGDSYANSINIPPQGDEFDSIPGRVHGNAAKPACQGQQWPYQDQVPDFRD